MKPGCLIHDLDLPCPKCEHTSRGHLAELSKDQEEV